MAIKSNRLLISDHYLWPFFDLEIILDFSHCFIHPLRNQTSIEIIIEIGRDSFHQQCRFTFLTEYVYFVSELVSIPELFVVDRVIDLNRKIRNTVGNKLFKSDHVVQILIILDVVGDTGYWIVLVTLQFRSSSDFGNFIFLFINIVFLRMVECFIVVDDILFKSD